MYIYFIFSYYKKRYSRPEKAGIPADADIKLNNKEEMKDEDAKPLPPLAALKPKSQETSFCM